MKERSMSVKVRRRLVARSTKASARLELRVVPDDHVRSPEVEKFVASLRAKA